MNRIKSMRLQADMKQVELAEKLSVSQAALSGYETGKYEPDFDTAARIASFFGVSVDFLMGLNTEKKPTTVSDDGQDPEVLELLKRVSPGRMDEVKRFLRFQADQEEKP